MAAGAGAFFYLCFEVVIWGRLVCLLLDVGWGWRSWV